MEELHQWRGRQFTIDLVKTHTWTDASDCGWGATMQNQMATFGWFSTTKHHIDLKEFRAGVNVIKAYLLRDSERHLHVDNMVLFHYLKKWGGRIPRLNNLIQELWVYCRQMNVYIIPHYVPSKLNPADLWSCQKITLTEASLDPRSMEVILEEIFVDAFGNRLDGECGEQAMSKVHFRIPSTRGLRGGHFHRTNTQGVSGFLHSAVASNSQDANFPRGSNALRGSVSGPVSSIEAVVAQVPINDSDDNHNLSSNLSASRRSGAQSASTYDLRMA